MCTVASSTVTPAACCDQSSFCALVPPSCAPLLIKVSCSVGLPVSRDGVIGTVGLCPPLGTYGNNRPGSNPLLASPEADRGKRWSVPRLTYRLLRWVGGRCVFSPKHISSRNLMEIQRCVFFLLNTPLRCFLSGLASLFGLRTAQSPLVLKSRRLCTFQRPGLTPPVLEGRLARVAGGGSLFFAFSHHLTLSLSGYMHLRSTLPMLEPFGF